jgi:hypothetical protein
VTKLVQSLPQVELSSVIEAFNFKLFPLILNNTPWQLIILVLNSNLLKKTY